MKRFVIIFLLLISVASSNANDIDKLTTIKDAVKFFDQAGGGTRYDKTDSSHIEKGTFYKIDVDNNGLTDLVISIGYCFVVFDLDSGHYKVRIIGDSVLNVLNIQSVPVIVVSEYIEFNGGIASQSIIDTLTYKFGGFIEYNAKPDQLKIEEIKFNSDTRTTGRGAEMKIDPNRRMTTKKYVRGGWNDVTDTIDTVSFDRLIQTINYIKLVSLPSAYYVDGADFITVVLEVRFNNGQIKKITDYGPCGTFGLRNLYRQLFYLNGTPNWAGPD